MARILMVEDDNEVAAIYQEMLTQGGHEAERAATGYGAILRAVHSNYDLILMDMTIRETLNATSDPLAARRDEVTQTNGVIVTMAIRWLGFIGPIVIVTGGVMRVDKEVAERAKYDGVLLKPVTSQDLLAEIARQLGEG